MGGRAHFWMRLLDTPVAANDIRDPPRVLGLLRVTRAVGEADFPFDIAQERERILELLREGAVVGRRVEADSEDDGAFRQVLGMKIAEPATLEASAGGVGLGIEPEDDILASVVGQTNGAVLVVPHREFRRRIANLEHSGPPEQLDD